jgi:hypothetical protein
VLTEEKSQPMRPTEREHPARILSRFGPRVNPDANLRVDVLTEHPRPAHTSRCPKSRHMRSSGPNSGAQRSGPAGRDSWVRRRRPTKPRHFPTLITQSPMAPARHILKRPAQPTARAHFGTTPRRSGRCPLGLGRPLPRGPGGARLWLVPPMCGAPSGMALVGGGPTAGHGSSGDPY